MPVGDYELFPRLHAQTRRRERAGDRSEHEKSVVYTIIRAEWKTRKQLNPLRDAIFGGGATGRDLCRAM